MIMLIAIVFAFVAFVISVTQAGLLSQKSDEIRALENKVAEMDSHFFSRELRVLTEMRMHVNRLEDRMNEKNRIEVRTADPLSPDIDDDIRHHYAGPVDLS